LHLKFKSEKLLLPKQLQLFTHTKNHQMKKLITLSAIAMLGFMGATAQVKIGTPAGAPDASAMLQVESSNKGLRLPQVALTTTTTFGLTAPTSAPAAVGMTVYNTTAGITSSNPLYPAAGVGAYTWDGTGWAPANSAAAIAALATAQDLRATGGGFLNHITKDAGVGSNGTGVGTGSSNIAMGTSTMSTNTTGSNNVAISINAMGQNTTGSGNVAIGPTALGQNKDGSNNVAIGNNALSNNSATGGTGFGSVAIGLNSLANNDGSHGLHVGIGVEALKSNTSGYANVGIGYNALTKNTTADYNTAVGTSAMETNVTGTRNVAVGYQTMIGSTGDFNTGIGSQALGSPGFSGVRNTGLGYQALTLLNSGVSNTGVGEQAMRSLATGNNNVAIGAYSAGDQSAGSNNISIGAAQNLQSLTASNQLNIGNSIWGTSVNTSFPAIGIGSGAQNPQANLHLQNIGSPSGYSLLITSSVAPLTGSMALGTSNIDGVAMNAAGMGIQSNNAGAYISLGRTAASTTGNEYIRFNRAGAGVGGIVLNGLAAVSYNTTSDIRLKENIRPTAFGIADLMKVDVRDYNYKTDKSLPQTGFIAQQLYTVYPTAVTPGGADEKTNPWMVDYSKVTPLLVKAIQDQQAEITDLKTRLERLEKLLEASNK
jgi:hypothetical protein